MGRILCFIIFVLISYTKAECSLLVTKPLNYSWLVGHHEIQLSADIGVGQGEGEQ